MVKMGDAIIHLSLLTLCSPWRKKSSRSPGPPHATTVNSPAVSGVHLLSSTTVEMVRVQRTLH